MKKLLISTLLVLAGSFLITSCTSVPRDNTSVPQDTRTRSTTTYSK